MKRGVYLSTIEGNIEPSILTLGPHLSKAPLKARYSVKLKKKVNIYPSHRSAGRGNPRVLRHLVLHKHNSVPHFLLNSCVLRVKWRKSTPRFREEMDLLNGNIKYLNIL